MRKSSLFGVLNLSLIIFVLGSYVIVAQSAVSGEWTANTNTKEEKADKIHISFERRHQNGGKSQNGTSYSYSELEGLSREQAQNGKVSFRLVREAGIIECEGSFTNGRGAGTFRFVANKTFVDAMKARGFDFEKQSSSKSHDSPEERLFAAATLNVTTALADDLKSANFGDLDVGDLFKAAIFKIDGKFMAEMKATGFPDLGMEDLVKARIFKIDAEYVRQVKDMGFAEQGFEGLVKFRIFKVTPEFLNELKTFGFDKLSSEDIVKCRIFKIDGEFIRQAKAEEPNISVEEMVQMKIGVRRRK
jgi:hypothetical protein